jgi:hypothetical protein
MCGLILTYGMTCIGVSCYIFIGFTDGRRRMGYRTASSPGCAQTLDLYEKYHPWAPGRATVHLNIIYTTLPPAKGYLLEFHRLSHPVKTLAQVDGSLPF